MAGKRKRGDHWEYVFKKTGVLEKPLYLTFATQEEGDAYAKKLEALLDRGIVPAECVTPGRVLTIDQLISQYMREASVKFKDQGVLKTISNAKGKTPLSAINSAWVDAWISEMKRIDKVAPGTIRSKIGAMARCTDWGIRKNLLVMSDHPFRTLPNGYAQYTRTDAAVAGEARKDNERDRRLEKDEHEKILAVIDQGALPRKQRPLTFDVPAVRCLYLLALESAMRMREMYTLSLDQIDLPRRTIFLDKTKNGDKRQVPLSSVALALLKAYVAQRQIPQGHPQNALFPWWDGSTKDADLATVTDKLSKLFANKRSPGIFDVAGCDGLLFHDLRHEATSRLFERTSLSDAEIMKITGHKSHRMMMRYANLRGSNLAEKLW